jgi:hypothetical protein
MRSSKTRLSLSSPRALSCTLAVHCRFHVATLRLLHNRWAALPDKIRTLMVRFTYEVLRRLQKKLVPARRGRSIFEMQFSLLMSSHSLRAKAPQERHFSNVPGSSLFLNPFRASRRSQCVRERPAEGETCSGAAGISAHYFTSGLVCS